MHFAAFALLALLAAPLVESAEAYGFCLLGLLAAGWLIECLQSRVPGRQFCWRDLAANACGIVFAALCVGAVPFL
jgi:VanZ family protein